MVYSQDVAHTDSETVIQVRGLFKLTSTLESVGFIGVWWACYPADIVVSVKFYTLYTFLFRN